MFFQQYSSYSQGKPPSILGKRKCPEPDLLSSNSMLKEPMIAVKDDKQWLIERRKADTISMKKIQTPLYHKEKTITNDRQEILLRMFEQNLHNSLDTVPRMVIKEDPLPRSLNAFESHPFLVNHNVIHRRHFMRHYDSNSSQFQISSSNNNSNDEIQIFDSSSPNYLETFVSAQSPAFTIGSEIFQLQQQNNSELSSNEMISVNNLYIKRDEDETSEEQMIARYTQQHYMDEIDVDLAPSSSEFMSV